MSQPQTIAGRYDLHEPIGQGGMGIVNRAYDRLTRRPVALKRVTIPPKHLRSATIAGDSHDFRLALAHEFRTLASLRHPNIISVLDYGFDADRQPFFTMELLENGQTLLRAAQGKSVSQQVDLAAQMLTALSYLHRRGILHRDLKPDNVLVVHDEVRLLDFGLAMAEETRTVENEIAGTLAYLAPELLQGSAPSIESDLYAAGLMLFEMLAGRPAYSASNLLDDILNSTPEFPPNIIDSSLEAVVLRLIDKHPSNRYPDAPSALAAISEATHIPLRAETATIRESYLQAARFVGREAEFARLSDALKQAVTGYGSVWLLGGESGVGKSRLLDEMRAQALVSGALVLKGQAVADGSALYQAWRDPLRVLSLTTPLSDLDASILKPVIPDLAALIDRPVSDAPAMDISSAGDRLLSVMESILRKQTQPTLLILEDMHWGQESIELLRRMAIRIAAHPIMVIASYRDDERPDLPREVPDAIPLKLERLTQNAIAALSESMLGEAGRAPALIELLQRETEGNTFFMVEVVRALAEEAGQLDNIAHINLPRHIFAGGMRTVVERRLSRVPESARPLLNLAAVLGRQLDLDILMASLTVPMSARGVVLDAWLTLCTAASILEIQDERWRFAHDKLREGVLASLSSEASAALSRQAALATEAVSADPADHAPQLAHLWEQAGDAAKTYHYCLLTAQQANENGAFADALASLITARALEPSIPTSTLQQVQARAMQFRAMHALGNLKPALEYAYEMYDVAGLPIPQGRMAIGLHILQQTLAQLFRTTPSQPIDVLKAVTSVGYLSVEGLFLTQRLGQALVTMMRAQGIARKFGKVAESAVIYSAGSMTGAVMGQHGLGDYFRRKARVIQAKVSVPSAMIHVEHSLAIKYFAEGKPDEAFEAMSQAHAQAENIGDIRNAAFIEGIHMFMQWSYARYETATALASHHQGYATEHHLGLFMRWAPNIFAWLMLHRGQIADAVILSERETVLITPDSDISSMWAYCQLAKTYIYDGQYEEAEQSVIQILPALARQPAALHLGVDLYADTITILASLWHHAAADDRQRYAMLLKDAVNWQARFSRWFPYGKPRRANIQAYIARLSGEDVTAERHARAALVLAARYRMPLDTALAYHTLARVSPSEVERSRYCELCDSLCADLGILADYLYPN